MELPRGEMLAFFGAGSRKSLTPLFLCWENPPVVRGQTQLLTIESGHTDTTKPCVPEPLMGRRCMYLTRMSLQDPVPSSSSATMGLASPHHVGLRALPHHTSAPPGSPGSFPWGKHCSIPPRSGDEQLKSVTNPVIAVAQNGTTSAAFPLHLKRSSTGVESLAWRLGGCNGYLVQLSPSCPNHPEPGPAARPRSCS